MIANSTQDEKNKIIKNKERQEKNIEVSIARDDTKLAKPCIFIVVSYKGEIEKFKKISYHAKKKKEERRHTKWLTEGREKSNIKMLEYYDCFSY